LRNGTGGGGGDDDDDDDSGCPTSPKAAVPGEREVLLETRECFVGRAHHLIKEQRRCVRTYEQKAPNDTPTPTAVSCGSWRRKPSGSWKIFSRKLLLTAAPWLQRTTPA
jgi:hypothetical protein